MVRRKKAKGSQRPKGYVWCKGDSKQEHWLPIMKCLDCPFMEDCQKFQEAWDKE